MRECGVSQVQHPSNQAVAANCGVSTVSPLHVSMAFAAASAHTCWTRADVLKRMHPKARTTVSTEKNMPTQKRTQTVCIQYSLCTFIHPGSFILDASRHMCTCTHACTVSIVQYWRRSKQAKKHSLTKNSSYCGHSTDIYSLMVKGLDAYSCVCVLQWEVTVW